MSAGIRSGVNWMRAGEPEHRAERLDELGLGEARHADEQPWPPARIVISACSTTAPGRRCAGEGTEQTLVFTTNVGDVVQAGPAHPLRIATCGGAPRPYVLVRGRLEARILRAPFYELVDWAEPRDGRLGVWSGGVWWELGEVS
jgi:hypothetical protein